MLKIKKLFLICVSVILVCTTCVGVSACDLEAMKARILGGGEVIVQPITDDDSHVEHESGNFPDYVRFYPYLEDFKRAQTVGLIRIQSRDVLVAYVEYVAFYEIGKKINITLTYATDFMQEIESAYNGGYLAGIHLSANQTASYGGAGSSGHFIIQGVSAETATLTLDAERERVYPQKSYALKTAAPATRAENFDDFLINGEEKAVLPDIYTSEQLRWAIQNGFRPECKAGSPAERVYARAKEILREIIDDEMDDITKARVIYEWLVLNVQYDHYAADFLTAMDVPEEEMEERQSTAYKYDSWYAEGVFLQGKAVCEGYAKAFIILAGIEDIPAIFVTGNGHAWNRAFLNGAWYVVDATHGDPLFNGSCEQFTYACFMITDEEKAYRGYPTADYPEQPATAEYNIYAHISFDYQGAFDPEPTRYDLVPQSREHLKAILQYAKSLATDPEKDYSVDVFVSENKKLQFDMWKSFASDLCESGCSERPYKDGSAVYTLYLK